MLQTKEEGQRRRTCSKKGGRSDWKKSKRRNGGGRQTQKRKEDRGRRKKEESRRREKRRQEQEKERRKNKKRRRSTLRVLPAETRLTVYCRRRILENSHRNKVILWKFRSQLKVTRRVYLLVKVSSERVIRLTAGASLKFNIN